MIDERVDTFHQYYIGYFVWAQSLVQTERLDYLLYPRFQKEMQAAKGCGVSLIGRDMGYSWWWRKEGQPLEN